MHDREPRELPTDEALLAGFLAGDSQSFDSLVRRYGGEIFQFVMRFVGNAALGEDVVQETFIQVHQSAAGFDASRRFKPWLFTIAANKARDALRGKSRRREYSLNNPARDAEQGRASLEDMLADEGPEPGEALTNEEEREIVREVVADMPDNLREVLLLGYFHRFPYQEIAQTLEIPLGTVKSRLHAAVAHFAEAYRRRRESQPG